MKIKKILNDSGQMSVFFATTILSLITFIAFIINIGVFVKSKINLQNAVDAAAWSGAATQARQLSNIAYLNWEMRNTFKEWMFKYYVLGNLSLDTVNNANGQTVDFRVPSIPGTQEKDSYNFPSICINFGNSGDQDICKTYSVPGLPVFDNSQLTGIDETTTAFLNTLSAEKNKNCTTRSQINFLTANLWAYNIVNNGNAQGSSILEEAPSIASNHQGAFPQAFELALRIRNLEKFVNKKPRPGGVCTDPSNAGGNCQTSISNIINSESTDVGNERLVKAFMAGLRNIGSDHDNDMQNSFTLTELPPTPVTNEKEFSLSNLLIPTGAQNRTKHYLDLKLMTMNYSTFYTSFNPSSGNSTQISGENIKLDGQCESTKIALPVPGYPLGFVKNPRVLTYYAVKGEARFTGLFNPFNNDQGIKITAFAAAKPFGGRIGPMLMSVFKDESKLFARQSGGKFRSSPYLTGIDVNQIKDKFGNSVNSSLQYVPGAPLPLNGGNNGNFWLTSPDQPIGGFSSDINIVFSLPNIAYDYPGNQANSASSFYANDKIDVIVPSTGGISPKSGLYNPEIFKKLKDNLSLSSGILSVQAVNEAIFSARAPTLLDSYNYMIPTPTDINERLKLDSFGTFPPNRDPAFEDVYNVSFFAPLISDLPGSLYKRVSDIVSVYDNYMLAQEVAIKKYISAMNTAAKNISQILSSSDQTRTALDAARNVSNINFESQNIEAEKPSCDSIAGRFTFFYQGNFNNVSRTTPDGVQFPCPTPMKDLIGTFWNTNLDQLKNFYNTKIRYNPVLEKKLFSAYRPGPLSDASINGIWTRTIGQAITENMSRNYYSTKLVQLKSLQKNGSYDAASGANFAIMSEGNNSNSTISDLNITLGDGRSQFQNPLDTTRLNIDLSNIDH